MLRLTLTQMRASAGRLVAAGVAIVLGTAFVAASLMAGAVIERTTYDSLTARYADADLVLSGQSMTTDQLDQVRATDGVAAAAPMDLAGAELSAGTRSEYVALGPVASDERLRNVTLTEGDLPGQTGQIAVSEGVAERLGLQVGDELTLVQEHWTATDDGGTSTTEERTLEVVGLIASPTLYLFAPTEAVLTPADLADVIAYSTPDQAGLHAEVIVAVENGADVPTVATGLSDLLGGVQVQTVDQVAQEQAARLTGSGNTLVALLLGFAAIALIVAALVIANTFQVLVAQRTRSLALLRCVGADRRQIHSSVLTEAAILGVLSSVAGVALGVVLMALGLRVLAGADTGLPVSTTLVVTPAAVIVPILTGLVVTVAAALLPARLATRVAPLAALRPVDVPPTSRASKIRVAIAAVAVLSGAGLLALGLSVASGGDPDGMIIGLGVGILGGLVSLFGLLLGCVLVVPALIRLVGRLLARTVPARVAVANAVRNPRRTAATASALVIGVALVTMMSTGAMAANRALGDELAASFPVDLAARTPGALADEQVQAITGTAGITDTALLSVSTVETELPGLGPANLDVAAVTDGDLTAVVRAPEAIAGLDDGSIVVGHQLAQSYDLADGDPLTLTGPSGEQVRLTVTVTPLDGLVSLVTPEALTRLAADAPVSLLWARVADQGAYETVSTVQANLTEVSETLPDADTAQVTGAAVERAGYQQVVNTMLAVVVGLLAVSVVIALIGVANTLSLSVIERRRESAMLRALGLTRGQLRGMLGIEGLMIAGAGALIGIVAGLVYGWVGSAIILAAMTDVPLVVPWRDLGLVVLVALAAGLLASALPARTAARTPPAAALAVD